MPGPDDSARTDEHPLREMLRIAGPTVATMTSYTLMQFTDKWLVSRIGPEPVYVGAQGNGGLAAWVPLSVAAGTLMIINTFVAQNLGAGKADRGPAYLWNGLWLSALYWLFVLVPLSFALPAIFRAAGVDPVQAELATEYGRILLWGAVFTLFARCVSQFFYGMHRPSVVMAAGVAANIFNLFASMVFCYGDGPTPPMGENWLGSIMQPVAGAAHAVAAVFSIEPMGVAGSGVGTVLATLVEFLIPLGVFLSPSMHALYTTRSGWRWSRSHVAEILRKGLPAGLMFGNEMICWGFFMVHLVSHFGQVHATAGWIAHQYMSLSFMPAVGISAACAALVGRYQGMKRPDLAAARAWMGVRLALVYMGLCGLCFVLFRTRLIGFFVPADADPETAAALVRLGSAFLIATAAFQLFDAVAMVLSGALRGAGDTFWPGVATIVMAWTVIVLGGSLIVRFAPGLESVGPWIMAASYIALLCAYLLARFLSGKWRTMTVVREDAAG